MLSEMPEVVFPDDIGHLPYGSCPILDGKKVARGTSLTLTRIARIKKLPRYFFAVLP
jgi:hypothetical protein